MISFGDKNVTGVYYGTLPVNAVYYGDKLAWTGEEPRALKFTALEGSALSVQSYGSAPSITLEYSFDGRTWNPMTVNETWISVDAGDHCYVRGVNNEKLGSSLTNYNGFAIFGAVKAEGPIVSLLDPETETPAEDFALASLFKSAKCLKDASGLTFPETITGKSAFQALF